MFKLVINTCDAAFDNEAVELARILREVADTLNRLPRGQIEGKCGQSIQDINGNTVGKWELK